MAGICVPSLPYHDSRSDHCYDTLRFLGTESSM